MSFCLEISLFIDLLVFYSLIVLVCNQNALLVLPFVYLPRKGYFGLLPIPHNDFIINPVLEVSRHSPFPLNMHETAFKETDVLGQF